MSAPTRPTLGLVLLEHKCSLMERPSPGIVRGGELQFAGGVVWLIGSSGLGHRSHRPIKRGQIVEWSVGSRRRMLRTMLAVEFGDDVLMVTLTYPGTGSLVPHDGAVVHRHLSRFLARWRRRWGRPRGWWKLEFQRRGAPHFHVFVEPPAGAELIVLRRWVSETWWEVAGQGDADHLRAGTQVVPWRGSPVAYAWKYALGRGEKEYQHVVPADFANVGRWWGLIGIAPRWVSIALDRSQFLKVRRALKRWRRARSRATIRFRFAAAGMWVWAHVGEVMVTHQLVRCLMRASVLDAGNRGDIYIAAPLVNVDSRALSGPSIGGNAR